ncbi:hypothetical protein IFM89_009739 [Coptis chinensis]|uniref:Uncharacterized protein n=1 Tax=Coptis chinensis TaxID=261450 RepID=A0A835HBS3_9MAGN|nr:hypothetical protein IFM89_009739 [Coptis chinensis]
MVYADDDQVWDDYVKAHPDFGIWRTKSITRYEDLCIIFGDGGASGKHSRAPSEKVKNHGKHIPKDAGNMIGENLNGEGSQSPLVGSDYLGKVKFLVALQPLVAPSGWKKCSLDMMRGAKKTFVWKNMCSCDCVIFYKQKVYLLTPMGYMSRNN